MSARDWNAASYDRVSTPQVEMARPVLDRLPLKGDETVLDAGCGSGRVTELLLERLPRGRVVAVDSAPSMVEHAREALSGQRATVLCQSLTELELDEPVDAAFSNAVFHWIGDHERLFERLAAALRPGGMLVAQCGGKGNIDTFRRLADEVAAEAPFAEHMTDFRGPWNYAAPDETEARLRAAGFDADTFVARHMNFAALPQVLAQEELTHVSIVLADLGVSSMQLDNPARGFSYKQPGPLDLRMNPERAESAAGLLARVSETTLAGLLDENADEPHAEIIARLLKQQPVTTTHALDRLVRTGLAKALPRLSKPDLKMSVRRTLQALRIAVNDEFSALDALLRSLPLCLAPGGRVAILTFHSGEDRRVKKSFQAGYRAGVYSAIATDIIRPGMEETRSNRRASSAKLRWAVRAS